MFKKILTNDIIERVVKTFVEGVVAYLSTITLVGTDLTNTHLLKGILLGAIASGLSAVINLVQSYLKKYKEVK